MPTPVLPPAPNGSRSQQYSHVPNLCFHPNPQIDWPGQRFSKLSSLSWPEIGPLPGPSASVAQRSSPIITLSDQCARSTTANATTTTTTYTYADADANTTLSLTQHQALPAEATDAAIAATTAATTAGAVSPGRDRRVARQATTTPSTLLLGDSPTDPSFNQHHFSPSSLQHLTANHNSRATPYSGSHSSSISSPKPSLQHRQLWRHISRLQPHLQQICNPRYCCLHHEPQPRSLEFHPLSTNRFGTPTVTGVATATAMDSEDPHDIAAQQAAAKDYQPAHEVSSCSMSPSVSALLFIGSGPSSPA
jgi:hypothetical protein